jgi:hypothetical protein
VKKKSVLLSLLMATCLWDCTDLDTITFESVARTKVAKGTFIEGLLQNEVLAGLGFDDFLEMKLIDSRELKNEDIDKDSIDSIHATAMTLSIVNAKSGQDFRFISRIEFFLESEGLPRQRFAYGGPFPEGESTVTLDIVRTDISAYATAEWMSVTSEATGKRPKDDLTIEAVVDFVADLNIRGAACGK